MKQDYKRIKLIITEFDKEDVITTSAIDRHNAYNSIKDLEDVGNNSSPIPVGF